MVSRREVLVLGGTLLLSACGGSGSGRSGAPAGVAGPYGVPVASWSGSLHANGDVQLSPGDQPSAQASNLALRLGWGTPSSAAQQDVLPAARSYIPPTAAPGFSVAIWARNRGARTLTFRLRLFDSSGGRQVSWDCAVDPLDRWILLTMSPSQHAFANWEFGQDAMGAVRVEQQDDTPEGPWQPGDYLLFGEVYVDVPGQALFLITFDDGFDSQRNPAPPLPNSPSNHVTRTDNGVFFTVGMHTVVVGDAIVFPGPAPGGLLPSTPYWIRTIPAPDAFTLAPDATLATGVASSGFVGDAAFEFANNPAGSGQQIVESYGFKGSMFLVPGWLGTTGIYGYSRRPNKFMSVADALAMHAQGWSVGSHSFSHPSSAENAGLRLLGPYGYFLSDPVDFLPAQYVRAWGLDASFRRRAIRADAGVNVVTFENPHRFLVNMPITFVDAAPPGFVPGMTYYCQSIGSPVSATFASDQGSLNATVAVTAGWTGLASYRYPGATLDDSAIYQDIIAGIAGLEALGIPTGTRFFALPQGAADIYVRSACLRAGLQWVRGASDHAHTIATGYPTGGGLSDIPNVPGGWLTQPDSIETDNFSDPSIGAITGYIDDGITQRACGCSYHHAVAGATVANLDGTCASLRARAERGLVKVVTLDEMAALLGRHLI
jgi:hypothetical protein